MSKISEVFRQHYDLKLSYRDIARSLNISKTTVYDYLARGKTAGIGWPLSEGVSEDDLYNKLFLPIKDGAVERPLPNWEVVYQELRKKGVTLRLLWREYRDIQPNGLGYTQFCERYRAYVKTITPVMRQVHKGGEKTFVDYAGMTMPWFDIATGKVREAEIFVGALGASQFIFAEATATQQLPDWISSHIRMWEYFGGVSEVVVPDNLLSGVTKAHRYDPDINANYQHFSEYYGFAIVPARVREPKDKAKVENAVGIVEKQILAPLRNITFTGITEINSAIKKRLEIINNQPFQKMKTSRRELFDTLDKPALKHLPPERYSYADWVKAKIHIDYHFSFDKNFYSVPHQHIHHEVQIRATGKVVECFYKGKRIAVHVRSFAKYKYITVNEHMPPAHIAHAEWTPDRMKRWASKTGPNTEKFIDHMIASRPFPQQAYRACLGLLRLGNRFGNDRLENACARAYMAGATRYQHVESILENRLDTQPISHGEITRELPPHENIRGAAYYK